MINDANKNGGGRNGMRRVDFIASDELQFYEYFPMIQSILRSSEDEMLPFKKINFPEHNVQFYSDFCTGTETFDDSFFRHSVVDCDVIVFARGDFSNINTTHAHIIVDDTWTREQFFAAVNGMPFN